MTLPTADWAALAQHYVAEMEQAREGVAGVERSLAEANSLADASPPAHAVAQPHILRIENILAQQRAALARAEATVVAMRVMAEGSKAEPFHFDTDSHHGRESHAHAAWISGNQVLCVASSEVESCSRCEEVELMALRDGAHRLIATALAMLAKADAGGGEAK